MVVAASPRKQLGVQPPGDIEIACSIIKWRTYFNKIISYRFSGGSDLEGHSLVIFFICSTTMGSLEKAVQVLSKVLVQVKFTSNKYYQCLGRTKDGQKIYGSNISNQKIDF